MTWIYAEIMPHFTRGCHVIGISLQYDPFLDGQILYFPTRSYGKPRSHGNLQPPRQRV